MRERGEKIRLQMNLIQFITTLRKFNFPYLLRGTQTTRISYFRCGVISLGSLKPFKTSLFYRQMHFRKRQTKLMTATAIRLSAY